MKKVWDWYEWERFFKVFFDLGMGFGGIYGKMVNGGFYGVGVDFEGFCGGIGEE